MALLIWLHFIFPRREKKIDPKDRKDKNQFLSVLRGCVFMVSSTTPGNITWHLLPSPTVVVKRLCFHRCLSVHRGRCTPPGTPPGRHPTGQTPPRQTLL